MTPYIVMASLAVIWVYLYWVACLNYRSLRKVMIHHQKNHTTAVHKLYRLRAVIYRAGLQHALRPEDGPEEDRRALDRTMPELPAGPRIARQLASTSALWAGRFWEELREFI